MSPFKDTFLGNSKDLPLWPESWPTRKEWWAANLIVRFSIRGPEVWVGYRHRVKTAERVNWINAIQEVVMGLRGLGDRSVADTNCGAAIVSTRRYRRVFHFHHRRGRAVSSATDHSSAPASPG